MREKFDTNGRLLETGQAAVAHFGEPDPVILVKITGTDGVGMVDAEVTQLLTHKDARLFAVGEKIRLMGRQVTICQESEVQQS